MWKKTCDSNDNVISSYNEHFRFCQANDLISKQKELSQWVLKSLTFSPLPEVDRRAVCQAWRLPERSRAGVRHCRTGFQEISVLNRLMLPAPLKEHKKHEKPKRFKCLNPILFWGLFFSSHDYFRILRRKKPCIAYRHSVPKLWALSNLI